MAETDTQGTSKKLDAPTDVVELVRPDKDAYSESDHHRPAPLYQYGTLDTSDTGGAINNSVDEVSPVFREARAMNLVTAARALDPDDDGVGPELVILPESSVTVTGAARNPEDARAELQGAINRLRENPVRPGGMSPGQQAAAEEHDDGTGENDADGDGVDDQTKAGDTRTQANETGSLRGPETHSTGENTSRRGKAARPVT